MLSPGTMFRTSGNGRMTVLFSIDDELRRAREEADQADIIRAAVEEHWQSARRCLEDNRAALSAMAPNAVLRMSAMLQQARRILVSGDGRTIQFQRDLTERLRQIGFSAFLVVEEMPSQIEFGDLLISISRSGSTRTLSPLILRAKESGAQVVALTARSDSRLSRTADLSVVVPVNLGSETGDDSRQWSEALFDQASQWLCAALLRVLPSRLSSMVDTRV
jgi:6-phospho-3-hexuloisomerase